MSAKSIDDNRIPEWLRTAISGNKLSHAYIIEGDELTNKVDFALEFSKAILCEESPGAACGRCKTCRMISLGTYRDIYFAAADERSVKDKDIEEIQERLSNLPMERGVDAGGRNIAIIENADTMTTRAQNRLLKSLEEPHVGTVIMLLSENSENLLPTIKSRCQTVRLYGDMSIEDDEYMDIAERLIKGEYFFEGKKILDENLKDRKSALAILDGIERKLRNEMVSAATKISESSRTEVNPGADAGLIPEEKRGASAEKIEFCKRGIEAVESARKDIKYNVREKYALSELLLKIGG